MHFSSKLVNYLAASSLAIYLFQEGCLNCYRYIKQMYIDGVGIGHFLLMIAVFFILSMLVPIAIDKIRLLLFGRLEEKTAKIIDEKLVKRYIEDGK
jgi:surface polysaccharide O-acyltransferase-like enzyme